VSKFFYNFEEETNYNLEIFKISKLMEKNFLSSLSTPMQIDNKKEFFIIIPSFILTSP